uniref:Brix domain-containing protein n=1 Tax=Panagrellus redivivus TaxID=6233 RepID=A0A7E4W6E7_PANRE
MSIRVTSEDVDAELASSLTMKRKLDKTAKSERGKLLRKQKNDAKRKRRDDRKELREKHGEEAVPKQEPKTIENMRELDETMVIGEDEEIVHDQNYDEMAGYFNRETTPKIVMTTSPRARNATVRFTRELCRIIPGAEVFSRKNIPVKKIVKQAIDAGFTDMIILHEDRNNDKPDGFLLCHLPEGPTAYFKINSLKYTRQIKGVGESTSHYPEVILNNFNTRLGLLISRMLVCLFPQDPNFTGRRVVTFHNQRDYIFFRHHRYEFKREGEKAALHELGPRFTLKLKWIQKGTFNPTEGEYEWVLKRHEMEASRRRFVL